MQDKAWQGTIDYFTNDGYGTDPWGSRDTAYREENATAQALHGVVIYEPCNYASNVVYYHVSTEVCYRRSAGSSFSMPAATANAIGAMFSYLAWGSCMLHGSHTNLGSAVDGTAIRIIAYTAHQVTCACDIFKQSLIRLMRLVLFNLKAAVANLEGASSVVTDLQIAGKRYKEGALANISLNLIEEIPIALY